MAATISFGSPPRSIQLIVCTIIFHEYLSTFPTEVEVIWTRQLMNLTSILFILNRYNLLSLAILYSISSSCTSNGAAMGCNIVSALGAVSNVVAFAVWAIFSALRVYSIDNRNKYLAAVVFFLGMVPFVANTFGCAKSLSTQTTVRGDLCGQAWPISQVSIDTLVIVTRTCLIACDLIVLLVTWFNTGSAKAARKYSKMKASLLALLVRDGTISFALLLLLNTAHIVLVVTRSYSSLAAYSIPISSMIVSRFILTLRKIYLPPPSPVPCTQWAVTSPLSTVHFTTIEVESLAEMYSIDCSCSHHVTTSHSSKNLPSALQTGLSHEADVSQDDDGDSDGRCTTLSV